MYPGRSRVLRMLPPAATSTSKVTDLTDGFVKIDSKAVLSTGGAGGTLGGGPIRFTGNSAQYAVQLSVGDELLVQKTRADGTVVTVAMFK